MYKINHSQISRLLTICLFVAFFIGVVGVLIMVGGAEPAAAKGELATTGDTWYGLYTDASSYAPGDSIRVYSSAPDVATVFRLVRLDTDWTEITRTLPITVGPQTSKVGSFIEYPGVSLAGRSKFTLEGWLHPTLLGGDMVVVAGQFGLDEAAAGIIISGTGQLGAYVSDTPQTDLSRVALASMAITVQNALDKWVHLALTYDGAQVTLYADGNVVAQRAQSGSVASVAAPFRLGARSEAPGDLTGVLDGRLDSWVLWPEALSSDAVKDRWQMGLDVANPAPDLDAVELYVNFDDPYPSIGDSSKNGHVGQVINHGNPGVSGVYTETGRAFRLNHDQIVDAGWQATADLRIPAGTPSGMYAVQALLGPDFTPTQEGDRLSARAIAIRPAAGAERAPIAVVLPTNTWTSYNHWPHQYGPDIVTSRSRYPTGPPLDGGNNSAYGEMGDGVSLSYFHGWRRPSTQASPIKPLPKAGYSVRAPNSMYLVRWLDFLGFDYDVYSDDDFDQGLISAVDHRVLMPHSHHEYWSDGMLETMTRFLDDGGSVVAPAGNIFTWRLVYGGDRVIETRKFTQAEMFGLADLQSGIDWGMMGRLRDAALCNEGEGDYHGNYKYRALGVMIHITRPCTEAPLCFGQWEAQNTGHWLWRGSGLNDMDLFGAGRLADSYAVGHEADTWVEGMPLPGLADGQRAVILAEGTAFHPDFHSRGYVPDGYPGTPTRTCQDVLDNIGSEPGVVPPSEVPRGGTILYFPHDGGGHVLVIGASVTPWALVSDAPLSGLLQRSLACFAQDEGCGYAVFLPAISDG